MIKYWTYWIIHIHVMLMYLVEWLSTRELFWMKIVNTFMFNGPKSAGTKLIWLVNWMWLDSLVILGDQQEVGNGSILLLWLWSWSRQERKMACKWTSFRNISVIMTAKIWIFTKISILVFEKSKPFPYAEMEKTLRINRLLPVKVI